MEDIRNNLQKYDTWNVWKTEVINLICSKDTDEKQLMQDFIINDKADEVIKEHFKPPLSVYQIGLETTMKGWIE